MNTERLYKILAATTIQLRKGAGVIERPGVTEIFAMPHVDEIPVGFMAVDMVFLTIGVNLPEAERHRAELVEILKTYPRPDRLAGGPSYIEVGGEIGDQGAAFQLFALGKTLGLWDVITPATMGFEGAEARQMAGSGYIMMTGFNPDGVARAGDAKKERK